MTWSLAGTAKHQAFIQDLIDFYADEDRILAILLFGSLARGNWDSYSDIDLDIVTKDDVLFDVRMELERLCKEIKRKQNLDAIIITAHDEADVVLSNLLEFSIRYHRLADTKPAILDSMILLAGTLPIEQIHIAGNANRNTHQANLTGLVDQCIRYTLELYYAILRQRLWMALEFLNRIRALLMQAFAITHNGVRPLQFFEENASFKLQERLKQLSPLPEMTAIKEALGELMKLLENELDLFSDNLYQLTSDQHSILEAIKQAIRD